MSMLEAVGLGVRYGQTWAVRDCTLAVPVGHIVALVGSNGAGKTTLLHCAMGLTYPTCGTVSVLGGLPAGSLDALERVAFVAQDAPLYRQLSVKEMVEVGHVHACRDTRRGPPVAIFDPTGLGLPDDVRTLLNCPDKCSCVGGRPVTGRCQLPHVLFRSTEGSSVAPRAASGSV